MDEATRAVLPWFRDQAMQESATRWFFMRYLDMTGQHLRLRLRCSTAAVDRLHVRLPELSEVLRSVKGSGAPAHLVPVSPALSSVGAQKVRASLYSPELAKYGGPRGMDLVEALFTLSSEWYIDNGIVDLDPLSGRAALAVEYLRTAVEAAVPTQQGEFWDAHRRQWGWQLRSAAQTQDDVKRLVSAAAARVESAQPVVRPLLDAISGHVASVVDVLDRAEAARNPIPRVRLLLDLVHMDLNRWGYLPADECTLGLIAATARVPA
jgi:thiopeptide-type bacteriocin biosynthesis protein